MKKTVVLAVLFGLSLSFRLCPASAPAGEMQLDISTFEAGLQSWQKLPDEAMRVQLLTNMREVLADPDHGLSSYDFRWYAIALSQDGDHPVKGTVRLPGTSLSGICAVDAISPEGASRRAEAVVEVTRALGTKRGKAWVTTWATLRGEGLKPTPETLAALPVHLAAIDDKKDLRWALDEREHWRGWGSPALTKLLLGWLAEKESVMSIYDNCVDGIPLQELYETDPENGRLRALKLAFDADLSAYGRGARWFVPKKLSDEEIDPSKGLAQALEAISVADIDVYDNYTRGAMLRKLYETDPANGRRRILEAIAIADMSIEARALVLLPDPALPEFDSQFSKQLQEAPSRNAMICASRYGSAEILEDVRACYTPTAGKWASDLEAGLLRYLVKYDRAQGLEELRHAMELREWTGSYRGLLPAVLDSQTGADVNAVLVSFIADEDDAVAQSALKTFYNRPDDGDEFRAVVAAHRQTMRPEIQEYADRLLKRLEQRKQ